VKTHPVQIGPEHRELPIVNVGAVSVALLNLLGDTRLTEAAADELARRLPEGLDTLVTPEVKAVPLAHALSVRTGIPYVVARKTEKPYMVNAVSKQVLSITTGKPQELVIDGASIPRIRGKRVAIVDDVVSTGGTLAGLKALLAELGAEVVATLVVFTEGDERQDVIALGHLPLFPAEAGA
jgi:adenine phosphoribosyltransferase